ncbi:C4-dicarboxylate ABC transporter permease [Oceanicola sp. 22II-s10i]|uniref:TRAP transporter small permease n=1 Tax=Oceanicola sp. 22II-s10i TaxID=1317116 RepID=UPI000B521012|nr:TRAP transporter small permease [Oceanicola sp. 22II-s10i]OWU85649.1 C4-dicarboxylate ABC transporter permease [Oceanicola sp. 22II-s10i]
MRRFLDFIYRLSGGIAAALIVAICLLISAQILLNVTSRLMGPGWSYTIPSYADFAGFMLAGASFLALAYTLRMGGHIRVSLVTQKLSGRVALVAEVVALAVAIGIAGFAGVYLVALVQESLHYGDTSSGIVPIPLWIPQSVVTLGMGLLVLALVDTLVETLRNGAPVLPESAEE